MRVDSSNARAAVQAAKPQKPKTEAPQAKPEANKPAPQAAKPNRVDVRA